MHRTRLRRGCASAWGAYIEANASASPEPVANPLVDLARKVGILDSDMFVL